MPVYGQSPHLVDCLRSLAAQTRPSPVIISTSTPFEELPAIAGLFGARLHVHGPNLGIGRDWNAALDIADTDLVTLVHQDDLYAPGFAAETLDVFAQRNEAAFAFCDSDEVRGDGGRGADAPDEGPLPMVAAGSFHSITGLNKFWWPWRPGLVTWCMAACGGACCWDSAIQ